MAQAHELPHTGQVLKTQVSAPRYVVGILWPWIRLFSCCYFHKPQTLAYAPGYRETGKSDQIRAEGGREGNFKKAGVTATQRRRRRQYRDEILESMSSAKTERSSDRQSFPIRPRLISLGAFWRVRICKYILDTTELRLRSRREAGETITPRCFSTPNGG